MAAIGALGLVFLLAWVPTRGLHECERTCGEDGGPRDCYYHLTLGWNPRGGCGSRGVLTINGQSPGPLISVCENDTVTVDLKNLLPGGMEAAVHWHGIRQRMRPTMDGVPMVTQCPVHSGATFRYRIKAEEAGTYYYRAHSVHQQLDGLFGALIVRPARSATTDRTILFAAETNTLTSFEPGPETDLTVSNLRFFTYGEDDSRRIRLINAAALDCPLVITEPKNSLTVLAVDGSEVKPTDVNHVLLNPGERVDVTTNPDAIQVIGRNSCAGFRITELSRTERLESSLVEDTDDYLKYLVSTRPATITGDRLRVYLSFDAVEYSLDDPVDFRYKLSEVTPYVPSVIGGDQKKVEVYQFGNVSFVYPSSPLLTQSNDVDEDIQCVVGERAKRCGSGRFCECVQVLRLPFNESVDLVVVDEGRRTGPPQTIHLHGYKFRLLMSSSSDGPITVDRVRSLLDSQQMSFVDPVEKDTVMVPKPGYVVLRVVTNNPGDWLLESVPSKAKTGLGLELVVRVPSVDAAPSGFPRCGSLKPQDLVIIDE